LLKVTKAMGTLVKTYFTGYELQCIDNETIISCRAGQAGD